VLRPEVTGFLGRDRYARAASTDGAAAGQRNDYCLRSTVARICAQIKTEFEAWSRRPLDDVTLDYLFLDAQPLSLPRQRRRRAGAGRLGHRHRRPARCLTSA
jgi:Transposase, Mutator family